MAVEELWAWLEQTADPASSKLTWPSLRELYADVMGSGYENIVRLRRDLQPTPKRLCAVGLVALCEIEWCAGCSTRWSGLFSGRTSGVGLLRLSTACHPPFGTAGGSLPLAMRPAAAFAGSLRDASLFPFVALKFARGAGAPSANLLFAGKKTGQHSDSFFAAALCTAITEKTPLLMRPMIDALRKHSAFPCHLGLSDVAATDAQGVPSDGPPRFPWALILMPTTLAQGSASACAAAGEPGGRFVAALPALPALGNGAVLYDVYAAATPFACEGPARAADPQSGLVRAGRLVLRSRFVRSAEDRKVAFWHQRKEEDYALRPEWLAAHGAAQSKACGADDFARLIAAGHYSDV